VGKKPREMYWVDREGEESQHERLFASYNNGRQPQRRERGRGEGHWEREYLPQYLVSAKSKRRQKSHKKKDEELPLL